MADILLTIDVEDWFQVENLKKCISHESWPTRELRVERNTHRLLDLFDSVDLKPTSLPAEMRGSEEARKLGSEKENNSSNLMGVSKPQTKYHPKATFFILGWIAERLPNLVKEISKRGHEVASHGYNHNLCYQECREDLKKDLCDSKKLLEDITGERVLGYRAPNFSIDADNLKLIQDCGYLYDSSYNSFSMHGRYGKLVLPGNEASDIAMLLLKNVPPSVRASRIHSFFELPISNFEFKIQNSKLIIPWGGGFYFRVIPLPIFIRGVNSILKKTGAYIFYIHPWEIDSSQPRISEASSFRKFRHYVNLSRTYSKLLRFLGNMQHHQFPTCARYIHQMNP